MLQVKVVAAVILEPAFLVLGELILHVSIGKIVEVTFKLPQLFEVTAAVPVPHFAVA